MWWFWAAAAIDQQNRERAAAEAAAAAARDAANRADRPRMRGKLLSMGYTEAQASAVDSWSAGDLERRLPRIDAMKLELIGDAQARDAIFLSDSAYSAELEKAKGRKKFLVETAARSGVPVDVIASAATGINPVDAQGNVDWTQARKIETRAQESIAVYDFDQLEDKLANKGIYLTDLGIFSAKKTPEEARKVMAILKEKGIALDGPAELGNLAVLADVWSQISSQNAEAAMRDHEQRMFQAQIEETKRQERLADWSEVAGWFGNASRARVNPLLLGQITIQFGSKGPMVRLWQEFLIRRGYSLGPAGADGLFGGYTRDATKAFQRDLKLTVDGIVGAQTWGAMEHLESPPAPPAPLPAKPSAPKTNTAAARKSGWSNDESMPSWVLPVGALAATGVLLYSIRNLRP